MLSHNSRIWNRSLPRSKYALYFGTLQLIGHQIIIKLKPKSDVKSHWNMLCFALNNLAICIKLWCNLHQISRSFQSYCAIKWQRLKDKRKEPRISKPLNGFISAKKAVFHFYLVMLKRGKKQDIKFTKSQFQRNCFIKLQRLEQKLSKVLLNSKRQVEMYPSTARYTVSSWLTKFQRKAEAWKYDLDSPSFYV